MRSPRDMIVSIATDRPKTNFSDQYKHSGTACDPKIYDEKSNQPTICKL
jgi:hypothetical protein